MNIDQLIGDWQQKLMLAGNSTEREYARIELERLNKLKEDYKRRPGGDAGPVYPPRQKPVVLIIHGHDEEMKRHVQLFLSRGGLRDLVWDEEPDMNKTIIEKLTDDSILPDYVIALMSPDDMLHDGTLRARQNVILEIGFYIGKLGREKVRILLKGSPEIPSDLQGILYDEYDTYGAWKMKLAKEIKAAGIAIQYEGIIQHS